MRRSASHAVLDALRPLRGAARHCVACAIAVKNAFFQLSCDAPRRMPFWTLCVLCVALRVTASPVPAFVYGRRLRAGHDIVFIPSTPTTASTQSPFQ
ncbi:hypothetical protein B0B36_19590 [Pseudomonas syringae pv. actinidifoliorum]|nr:hypothetical protein B0B36_19590 [Pseudomonas syringae pv. actinidifoliorum]